MSETVLACPHCDQARLQRCGSEKFRCSGCMEHCAKENAVERAPRGGRTPKQGLAATLAKADPSEVSR